MITRNPHQASPGSLYPQHNHRDRYTIISKPDVISGRALWSTSTVRASFNTCISSDDRRRACVIELMNHATGGQCAGSLDVSSDVGGIHCQNAAGGG